MPPQSNLNASLKAREILRRNAFNRAGAMLDLASGGKG
jgi:hypothetical protein